MAEAPAETRSRSRPYRESWVDLFIDWVSDLKISAWLFYLLFGLGLILVQVLFSWLDGGIQPGGLIAVIIFNAMAVPYLLALINLLDQQANTALKTISPVLDRTENDLKLYAFRLSNMPFTAPLIAGGLMTILVLLTPLVAAEPESYAALQQMPVFKIIFHVIDKASAFLFGVFLYHTIRQLRLVDDINSHLRVVNLSRIRPLQAFSRLTASTAIGLLIFVYPWIFINPEILANPVSIGYIIVFSLIAAIVFAWPLWNIHRVIENEKKETLQSIDARLEIVFSQFNQRFDQDDYGDAERLNGIITSLEIQRKHINAVPTWPWRSETARLMLTAIALPLMLMMIQYFVLQALNP
jgi:hypothetical protein